MDIVITVRAPMGTKQGEKLMNIKTFEKIAKTVEVVTWNGGREEAIDICKWMGSGSSYIPATKIDPRSYIQLPTMFGPRDIKSGSHIVKIGPGEFLPFNDESLYSEYREIMDTDHRLVQHSRRELSLFPNEDLDFRESLVSAIKGFTSYRGHSGASAEMAIDMLTRLLNGENLMALTDDPEEWEMRAKETYGVEQDMWQNNRNSKALSLNGGKTYFLVDEEPLQETADSEPGLRFYSSEPKGASVEIDPEDLKSDGEKEEPNGTTGE